MSDEYPHLSEEERNILFKKGTEAPFSGKHLKENRAGVYSCAVCGYGVRMGEKLVGVEAAHIKWHKAGGPDVENNGIALCSLHHKLFDLGVYTIDDQLRMLVSEKVHGQGAEQWLISFHGKSLRPPQSRSYYPESNFLQWHVKEVFKGGYRKLR